MSSSFSLKKWCVLLFALYLAFSFCPFAFGKEHYKYNLAMCAIFKNEAPYLKEWIEFHRLMGVKKFYLYNNQSTDNYQEILAPYIKMKIVSLQELPVPFSNELQCKAYKDAFKKTAGKAKWLALLDIDEFLFPVQVDTLTEFLKDYEDFAGIGVNWQMYGTSYVTKIQDNRLLIECLTRKAPLLFRENIHIKSIVQPDKVADCTNPHSCHYKRGYYQVNSNKVPFSGPFSPYILVDKIRVNHYWTRDEYFFNHFKIARRQGWGEGLMSISDRLNNLNQEEDQEKSIQRFCEPLRERVFQQKIE